MVTLRTSPSNIAKIMENGCQRSLFFHAVTDDSVSNLKFLKTHYGIDVEAIQNRQAVKNQFLSDAGNAFETEILTDLNLPAALDITSYGVKGKVYPPARDNTNKVSYEDTLALLCDLHDIEAFEKKHGLSELKYLYQLTFVATESFKRAYHFEPNFDFNWSNPDLIMITKGQDGLLLSVIDIKLAEHTRLRQKLQISLYALLLDHMIKELKQTNDLSGLRVDLKAGYIWHKGQACPTPFDMDEVLPYLEQFLSETVQELSRLLAACPKDALTDFPARLPHSLCTSCEYCSYLDYCLEQSRKADDFQRIPYLSSPGQRSLEALADRQSLSGKDTLTSREAAALLRSQLASEEKKELIHRNPALRDYIKTADGTLLIECHERLLHQLQAFDYRRGRSLYQKLLKKTDSPDEMIQWLCALMQQKELDRAFLLERKTKLQQCLDAFTSENENERSRKKQLIEYLQRYQSAKLEEVSSILALSGLLLKHLQGEMQPDETDSFDLAQKWKELLQKNIAPKGFYVRANALTSFPQTNTRTLSLFLTAQKDQISGKMFALAYSYNLPAIIHPSNPVEAKSELEQLDKKCILIAEREEDLDRIAVRFIEELHKLFSAVNAYNAAIPNASGANLPKICLQCYVMDRYEADNLTACLYDLLDRAEGELGKKIMDIVSWLPDERMASQNEAQSELVCDYPFVSLTESVQRMFVLPAEVAYSFDDIAGMFVITNPFSKNTAHYSQYFGNSITAGFIRRHWEEPQAEEFSPDKLRKEISMRLSQESLIRLGIVNELNSEAEITGKKLLISHAPTFQLPTCNPYSHPLLSRLHFQCHYEELLARLEKNSLSSSELNDLTADNDVIELVYLGMENPDTQPQAAGTTRFEHHRFRILNPNDGIELPEVGLTLSPADENALRSFNHAQNKLVVKQRGYWGNFYEKAELQGDILHLYLNRKNSFLAANNSFAVLPGMHYYLFERYTDYTSSRLIQRQTGGLLRNIDDNVFSFRLLPLLENPCAFVTQYLQAHGNEPGLTAGESLAYENDYFAYPFAASQRQAFLQFYNQNLSLIQGPPGTGKTNFIAMSVIIWLLRQHELGCPKQKIFVTANSHVALENVLAKIASLLEYMRQNNITFAPPLKLYQVEGNPPQSELIEQIPRSELGNDTWMTPPVPSRIFNDQNHHVIVGSTVWALESTYQKGNLSPRADTFDVVILDEASQVRLVDSLIPLAHIKESGKILLAGDHEQLPPIIHGTYEETDGQPFTGGSVFQYFIEHDLLYRAQHGRLLYSKRLSEQFRMNEILSLYPSMQIYEGDYRPANEAVATQRLTLAPRDEFPAEIDADMLALCEWLMDPEYPFVLCNIRSVRSGDFLAADEKKRFEIELVKQLSSYCMHCLCQTGNGNFATLYDDAEKFWHEGMFIISPHHEHINRLRAAVKELRRDDLPGEQAAFGAHAFIDTVDKMQGQEAEIALVSYGISNEDQALREKEFIYNRNRLNVSITRGKKKMILILTDVLTEKRLELMAEEDQQLIDGIAFMNSIKHFAANDPAAFYSQKEQVEKETATLSQFKNDWVQGSRILVETYRKKIDDSALE